MLTLGLDRIGEGVVAPEFFQRHAGGDKGMIVAPEGAVVFGGLPDVMLGLQKRQSEGQTHARKRFRLSDDVGVKAELFERKERARAPAPGLDVIEDEQRAVFFGDCLDLFEPFARRSVQAALTLYGFDEDRGGGIDAARRIVEHLLEHIGGIDVRTEIALEGRAMDAIEVDTGTAALAGIARRGERAKGHAMKAVGEGDHIGAAGHLAGQLDGRFNGVGTSGTCEHELVVHAARLEEDVLIGHEELFLGLCEHVQPVGDAIGRDVIDQSRLHVGVVVTVVQRGTAGEKIDIFAAVVAVNDRTLGLAEEFGKAARIRANLALDAIECFVCRSHCALSPCFSRIALPIAKSVFHFCRGRFERDGGIWNERNSCLHEI